MVYEIAKAVLEQAKTPVQRVKAVRVAMGLGMPLNAIEQYLDWLDAVVERREERVERRE
jgi:hypothetical protein